MARKLNRQKPFGEVCGGNGKAKYVQDGIDFDAEGNEIGGKAEAPPKKAPEQEENTQPEPEPAKPAGKATGKATVTKVGKTPVNSQVEKALQE